MRINKWIASSGFCSRRKAEEFILSGEVKINNQVCENLATQIQDDDKVEINGKLLSLRKNIGVWCFYKPRGVITTHNDPENRQTVFDFLKKKGLRERVISIGRLDYNSEGLLLLTNNSDFACFAEKPGSGWVRKYKVRVYGDLTNILRADFSKGIKIEDTFYKPFKVDAEKNTESYGASKNQWLIFDLMEGKNREIRKICEHYDLQVSKLIRTNYGPFSLLKVNNPGDINKSFHGSKQDLQKQLHITF